MLVVELRLMNCESQAYDLCIVKLLCWAYFMQVVVRQFSWDKRKTCIVA